MPDEACALWQCLDKESHSQGKICLDHGTWNTLCGVVVPHRGSKPLKFSDSLNGSGNNYLTTHASAKGIRSKLSK